MDQAIIDKVKGFGFDVYTRDPKGDSLDTYLFFTDGINIGYMQKERLGGYSFTTVHKPSTVHGTGFSVHQRVDDFTKDDLLKCFITMPDWAWRRDGNPVKFKNMDEFLKYNNWNATYHKR